MRPLLPIEQSEGKCQVAKCSCHSRRPLTGKSSANAAILVCFAMRPLKAGQRLLGVYESGRYSSLSFGLLATEKGDIFVVEAVLAF